MRDDGTEPACACGCGGAVTKGRRFVHGHNRKRRVQYEVRDLGYATPCWIWLLSLSPKGYGKLDVGGRSWRAHRWYFTERFGDIPEGMQLDHLCRNRACVNPEHLEPVTNAENSRRGDNSKLTIEQVLELKPLIGTMPFAAIGRRYGVSASAIKRIATGEGWSDVGRSPFAGGGAGRR